jgi:hypothetical protein
MRNSQMFRAGIHDFETIPKRVSKPGIHHLRQMQRPANANLLFARGVRDRRAEPLAFA